MALPEGKRGAGCTPDESQPHLEDIPRRSASNEFPRRPGTQSQAKSPSGFFIFSDNSANVLRTHWPIQT